MTTAIDAPAKAFTHSSRYLWGAVGLLGAATIAMGAALVHERTKAEPPTTVASSMQATATPLALLPPAQENANILKPKVAETTVDRAQAAPKSIAKPKPKVPAAVAKPGATNPATPEPEWLPVPAVVAQAPKVVCASCGTVESVTPIQREAAGSGAGAVAGAVLGGLLGNQVGGGDGKTIATVIGVLGGGWAGNTVEKRMKKEMVYQVEVRMEDGSTRTVEQTSPIAVGSRVTVDGNVIGPAAPIGATAGAHPTF